MRVLHINCNYLGTTLHQLMIEKLDCLGNINQVYVPTHEKSTAVITPNENVVVSECFKKRDRVLFDYKQNKILKDIEKKIDISKFQCIHAYTLFTDGNCARKLSKKYLIPYVVAVRNTDVNDFFRLMPHLRRRGVAILRDAGAIFFLSESYRKQVFDKYIPEKLYEEISAKTHIIPNGIDDFWLQNRTETRRVLSNKRIRIVYAGRIDKNKNITTTQKAVHILRQKGYDATLTVIGMAADKKEFEIIEKDEYTTCIPQQPKERLIEFYRSHDIFVMPSFAETFGLVYAEAMSQGLPVIYTKGQGFDEQFPEGQVGYAVDAESAYDIADRIEKICGNYSDISNRCSKLADKFEWNKIVEFYTEMYVNFGNSK